MRLEGIQTGDIVKVDHKGRRFHALVTGPAPDGLALAPMDRRVNHYSARSREIVGHWVKRGRPKTTTAPLRPSERHWRWIWGSSRRRTTLSALARKFGDVFGRWTPSSWRPAGSARPVPKHRDACRPIQQHERRRPTRSHHANIAGASARSERAQLLLCGADPGERPTKQRRLLERVIGDCESANNLP